MNPDASLPREALALVFADDRNNMKLREQLKELEILQTGLNLKSLVVLSDTVEDPEGNPLPSFSAARLRQDFKVRPDEFLIILLGKDGRLKLKEAFVTKAAIIRNTFPQAE